MPGSTYTYALQHLYICLSFVNTLRVYENNGFQGPQGGVTRQSRAAVSRADRTGDARRKRERLRTADQTEDSRETLPEAPPSQMFRGIPSGG